MLQGYLVLVEQTVGPWMLFGLAIAASLVGAKIVQVVVVQLLKLSSERTDNPYDDILFQELPPPTYMTLVLAGVYSASHVLTIPAGARFTVWAASMTIITVVWTRFLLRVGRQVFDRIESGSRLDTEFTPIFENLYTLAILIGAVFALLSVWNVNITPLIASLGVAGVAVGFAAKDTVANFFGGLALYFDHTYKIGDYVVLDSGEEGTVQDVGIRSTVLRRRDDTLVTIPNAVLNSAHIRNESAPALHKRITVPVGVAYGTDIDHLEEILLQVAEEDDTVLDEPAPRTFFKAFGDNALEYELRCWVPDPTADVRAVDALNREIYAALNEAGIEIPFPQRSIHIEEASRTDTP